MPSACSRRARGLAPEQKSAEQMRNSLLLFGALLSPGRVKHDRQAFFVSKVGVSQSSKFYCSGWEGSQQLCFPKEWQEATRQVWGSLQTVHKQAPRMRLIDGEG